MIILQALYFFLPAYLANIAPVIIAKIFGHHFETPIDFKQSIRGNRIFGDHKTWRGLIAGTVVGMITVYLQQLWYNSSVGTALSILDYNNVNPLILGGLLGFGALAGDAIKSFFKRRRNLRPGTSWPPFDQLDFVIGGIIAAAFIVKIPLLIIVLIVLITPALHLLSNKIAYKLGLKANPW